MCEYTSLFSINSLSSMIRIFALTLWNVYSYYMQHISYSWTAIEVLSCQPSKFGFLVMVHLEIVSWTYHAQWCMTKVTTDASVLSRVAVHFWWPMTCINLTLCPAREHFLFNKMANWQVPVANLCCRLWWRPFTLWLLAWRTSSDVMINYCDSFMNLHLFIWSIKR